MKKLILGFIGLFVVFSCARIVYPTGGPKDEDPPRLIKAVPPVNSINFSEKKIVLTFNEFVVLKNINQELLISPPQKNKPLIKQRDKDLIIEFNDTLRANATYNICFFNAITDLHEGNVLKNFQYIFSTGSQIDSFCISGKVLDARNLNPEDKLLVLAWKNPADSAPYKTIPDYYTRTDKDGKFSINNISKDNYLVMALKDANNNLLFDMPQEKIAFSDTLITPNFKEIIKYDTLHIQNINNQKDTIVYDSVVVSKKSISTAQVILKSFQEDYEKNFIKSYSRPKAGLLQFLMNKPGAFQIHFQTIPQCHTLFTGSKNNDTLQYWLTDSICYKYDTINAYMYYNWYDKDSNLIESLDTFSLKYHFTAGKPYIQDSILKLKVNIQDGRQVAYYHKIFLSTDYPVIKIDQSKFDFQYSVDDKDYKKLNFMPLLDSANMLVLNSQNSLMPESFYKLTILPGAVTSLYSLTNDTLQIKFTTDKTEDYSHIKFRLNRPAGELWLELTDDKDKILMIKGPFVKQEITTGPVKPGKYFARIFIDLNGNKKWDSGNYIRHIQPEPVYKFSQPLEIKPNWDYDFDWKLDD